ncbi:MAG: SDR family oxidoreductase [Chloroflexi bacterium]|nr:SDR family oxidoreductase [Chloroflexota bacterium]
MSRTIVVTGSASGIGKATAELFVSQGHSVIGVDIKEADVVADLSNAEGRQKMVDEVTAKTSGVLDAVVACAGLSRPDPITVAVNYYGAIATLEGLRPLLEKADKPRAAVIASVAATFENVPELVEACLSGDEAHALQVADGKGDAIYASTKNALAQWVRLTAPNDNWAGKGILLNTIGPGVVETPMTEALLGDEETVAFMRTLMPLPLGNHAQPEEIAHLLAFLVSPENSHMVGQMIYVDGGGEATKRGAEVF